MALLQEFIPDILFLDIHMPCRDGRQCIREIRANPLYDRLPVIIYSGMGEKDIISSFYREGANQFLIKPSTMDELKQALDIIFKNFYRDTKR
jgi:CheY-like chemotaxis protein